MSEFKPARIVVTGGPGSGKTELIERLRTEPELKDCLVFDELARQILKSQPSIRTDKAALHLEIYRRQCAREDEAEGRCFITDRGSADIFAFHPEALAEIGTTLKAEYRRYTAVIQLGTAAVLGDEYYRKDSIRTESIAEAVHIEEAIKRVWRDHPNYVFVPASPDLEQKFDRSHGLVVQYITGRSTGGQNGR
jgi:predicted ATPase